MNTREKILAAAAGAVLMGLVGYLVVDRVVLEEAARLDRQGESLQDDLDRIRAELARRNARVAKVASLVGRTFETDPDRASDKLRTHLGGLLDRSGLGSTNPFLKPFTAGGAGKHLREVGWFVRARGRLEHVVNFLFLLDRDPYLHTVESVVVKPVQRSPDVDLQVRVSVPVLTPPRVRGPDGKAVAFEPDHVPEDEGTVRLDGPDRQAYDAIVARDLFRPYVKRGARPQPVQVVRHAAPSQPAPPAAPPAAPPPQDSRYRVVGLPRWGEGSDVYVYDAMTRETRRYQVGDRLAGGEVAMVDYRPMPLPDRPWATSGSRVILRIGPEHWAVELGQSLAEKRILAADDLPAGLPHADATPEPDAGASEAAVPETPDAKDGTDARPDAPAGDAQDEGA